MRADERGSASTVAREIGRRFTGWTSQLSLAQRFLVGSLIILAVGMTGIGLWVSHQIEDGIVHRTASTTALYVDSLIAGPLQGMATDDGLSPEAFDRLNWLMEDTPLGRQVAIFRVWDLDGTIVYSTDPTTVGQQLPIGDDLAEAINGEVTADVGSIEGPVNLAPGLHRHDLLEIYSPIRGSGTDNVIAVAEFYYGTADIQSDITRARRQSWLIVAGVTVAIYFVLAIFVQRASNTIARQQRALANQVDRLTDLLHQNDDLRQRVQGAAARTTALNERFLRRFAAELHDGPAQDISLALLRLDDVAARTTGTGLTEDQQGTARDFDLIQNSLRSALNEVRAASAGIMLPRLAELSPTDVINHAIRAHRRRTNTTVEVDCDNLPNSAPIATKIALYRIIQEGLTNAWRHADGKDQRVHASDLGDAIRLEISDQGPGFDVATMSRDGEHLGLIGIRERVESLAGSFHIESTTGENHGTRLVAILPLTSGGAFDV